MQITMRKCNPVLIFSINLRELYDIFAILIIMQVKLKLTKIRLQHLKSFFKSKGNLKKNRLIQFFSKNYS